jgi:hypothetical protein
MTIQKIIRIVLSEPELEVLEFVKKKKSLTKDRDLILLLITSEREKIMSSEMRYGKYQDKDVTSETSSKMTKLQRTQETKKRLQEMPAKEAEEYIASLGLDAFSDIDRLEFPDNPGCFDMCHHAITDDPERGRIFEIQLYHMNDPEKKIISRREQCSFEDLLKALVSKKLI